MDIKFCSVNDIGELAEINCAKSVGPARLA